MAGGPSSVDIAEVPPDSDMTSPIYTVIMGNTTTTVLSDSHNKSMSNCGTIDTNYDISSAVISALCLVLGVVYTFFGYRCFKAVMFLTGFIFGSVLVYMICLEQKTFTPLINGGIALGAGLLFGLLTMLVQYVGLFLTGFNLGISIATGILIILEQLVLHYESKWIPIGLLVGVGLVSALLTLKFQKAGTILGTSFFGGILMISCIDYFIEQFLLMVYIWERIKADVSLPLCWYSWVILGCWPFCFLVGTVAQWKITSVGFSHKEVLRTRRCRKFTLRRSRSKEKPKEMPHQSRYRHLYQVRRVKGDVISQNYIQNIQNKLSPSLRNMTPVPTEPQTEVHTEPESTNTTLTQISWTSLCLVCNKCMLIGLCFTC